jgi:hypothetical protein
VLVHNDYLNRKGFEYALGAYQGRSETVQFFSTYDGTALHFERRKVSDTPVNMEPTVVFRIGYSDRLGTYSEADFESEDYLLGLGLSGLVDVNANLSDDSRVQLEFDFIFKIHGLSASGGVFAEMRQNGPRYVQNRQHGAGAIYVQGGYLIAGIFEPTVRFQAIISGEGAHIDSRPYSRSGSTLGFNLYFKRHGFKWTNELTVGAETELLGQPEDLNERITLALSQMQIAF